MKIKLVITDDHPMVLKGLKNMLLSYPDIDVLATYNNGQQLLDGLNSMQPDVILLDLMMPEMNGDEALKKINKKYPFIKVIVLTNHGSAIYVNNLMNMGVAGYLMKTVEEETLYEAIHQVMKGERFVEPALMEKVEELNKGIQRAVTLKHILTSREKQVLQMIVDGNSSAEIAKLLFLSTHTIDTYRDNMMLKLEAKNTAELVKIAIKSGLVNI